MLTHNRKQMVHPWVNYVVIPVRSLKSTEYIHTLEEYDLLRGTEITPYKTRKSKYVDVQVTQTVINVVQILGRSNRFFFLWLL